MKKYYNERKFNSIPKIELPILSNYFLRIYKQLYEDMFFDKAELIWARDPEFFIFRKLGLWNILPFEENIAKYDEATLFSVIEFLYDYVYKKDFAGISDYGTEYFDYDKKNGQKIYRNMVNDVLRYYIGGYELSEDGEILKLSPPGFKTLIEEAVETNDPENIDSRVKYAISKFSRYNSSIEDKDAAIIKLSGVLEYLQKRGVKLPEKDDGELFHIMNDFNLRHKNRKQHTDYSKEVWYDWMFYTFLASIHVLLKLNDNIFDLKISHTG